MIIRLSHKPILGLANLKPSHHDLRVLGVFNPGATRYQDEILLLVRVAEEAIQTSTDGVRVPSLAARSHNESSRWAPGVLHLADDGNLDLTDPREIRYRGKSYLSSISHLRLARSKDGVAFELDEQPTILPEGPWESYGIEDPRITLVGDRYLIQYTAVSEHGVAVGLMETYDWKSFHRLGLIFPPQNKDVCIFPRRIGGKYVALHRPDAGDFSRPSIWLAASPDLIHWGAHRPLISPREGMWDALRIGGGAPPVETEAGWLEVYHGVSADGSYHLGALLLDSEDPSRVIARSASPLLSPESDFERAGFYSNTVFSNGMVAHPHFPDQLLVYYGAADQSVGVCTVSVSQLLSTLREDAQR